jgi:tRNA(Ile)-lysidine synthase
MFPEGAYILCAVSGGADSMCMLHMLSRIAQTGAIRIAAAHFDHGLRGAESDRDAEFVRDYCASNNITCYLGAGDVSAYAKQNKISIEAAARELRYDFLQKTALKAGADRIATAHTADDNAETVLINLIRGSGLKGLRGIPPVRDNIIRPVLCFTREQIIEYIKKHGIPYVEDSTNFELIYTRNKLRHSVIPLLKEINPRIIETLSKTSELIARDEEYLSSLADKVLSAAKRELQGIRISSDELISLPKPVAARLVMRASEELGAAKSSNLVDGVMELALSDSPSAMRSFAGGLTVFREYGDIVFTRLPAEEKTFKPVQLSLGETTELPELGLQFTFVSGSHEKKIYNPFNTFLFKKDAICGKITVRPRKSGDKISFGGKKGTKTLKKLFIDEKLPLRLRECIPVLSDEKGVIAVLCFGTDIRCVPAPGDDLCSVYIEAIGGDKDVGNDG